MNPRPLLIPAAVAVALGLAAPAAAHVPQISTRCLGAVSVLDVDLRNYTAGATLQLTGGVTRSITFDGDYKHSFQMTGTTHVVVTANDHIGDLDETEHTQSCTTTTSSSTPDSVPPSTTSTPVTTPSTSSSSSPTTTVVTEVAPPTTTAPTSTEVGVAPPTTHHCEEDEPCWDCTTMGNLICGPTQAPRPAGLPETGFPAAVACACATGFLLVGFAIKRLARRRTA